MSLSNLVDNPLERMLLCLETSRGGRKHARSRHFVPKYMAEKKSRPTGSWARSTRTATAFHLLASHPPRHAALVIAMGAPGARKLLCTSICCKPLHGDAFSSLHPVPAVPTHHHPIHTQLASQAPGLHLYAGQGTQHFLSSTPVYTRPGQLPPPPASVVASVVLELWTGLLAATCLSLAACPCQSLSPRLLRGDHDHRVVAAWLTKVLS